MDDDGSASAIHKRSLSNQAGFFVFVRPSRVFSFCGRGQGWGILGPGGPCDSSFSHGERRD